MDNNKLIEIHLHNFLEYEKDKELAIERYNNLISKEKDELINTIKKLTVKEK